MKSDSTRCWNTKNPLYIKYHDEEWGVPIHDDSRLFEFLVLEGFQAGLTWELILKRRGALRNAFVDFDPDHIAKFTDIDVKKLLNNPKIIRNKAKILATINNARKFLEIQQKFGTFNFFIWRFVRGKQINHVFKSMAELPSETEESRNMSKELKKLGFKFVGPTICYAFMQAIGMVNDHLTSCFRYSEIQKLSKTSSNQL